MRQRSPSLDCRGSLVLLGVAAAGLRSQRRPTPVMREPGAAALRHNPRQVVRHLSTAGRRCAPARHFENCLACEGSELASVCAAEPERCRARAAAITKGDERKRAVVQCVGPSLK